MIMIHIESIGSNHLNGIGHLGTYIEVIFLSIFISRNKVNENNDSHEIIIQIIL